MEYIYYIIIFSRDKYKVNYDKKIFVIINVIIGYVMYGGMIYIISPQKNKRWRFNFCLYTCNINIKENLRARIQSRITYNKAGIGLGC